MQPGSRHRGCWATLNPRIAAEPWSQVIICYRNGRLVMPGLPGGKKASPVKPFYAEIIAGEYVRLNSKV